MAQDKKITLYALDCGTVNWRLYRMEYHYAGARAQHVTRPLSSPLANFSDKKLPAVIMLTEDRKDVESIGETALAFHEDTQSRIRIREFFKPSIGSHLIKNPSPYQRRYTHFEALFFTRLLLRSLINQIQKEKHTSDPFGETIHFSIAYPDSWRTEHDGKSFEDFYHVVLECFPDEVSEHIRFIPESQGVLLGLTDQGLLEKFHSKDINLVIDVGGSHTAIYARRYNTETGVLTDISSYEEPFGGGLYDAVLAKYLSDELRIPHSEFSNDTSAFMSLRVWAQQIKEELSRQASRREESTDNQKTITLVMRNDQVFRKNINLTLEKFSEMVKPLDEEFQDVITRALENMGLEENSVGRVILIGGGVLLPGISEGIRERFGQDKVILPDNPEEVLVRGIGLSFSDSGPESGVRGSKSGPESKPGWRLTQEDGSVIDFNKEIMIAGRSNEADIPLESKKCSRTHALIRLEGNVLTLIDLRSKNGTYVNRSLLAPHLPKDLKAGDEIRFGDQVFVLE
jgi:hypothetical protein